MVGAILLATHPFVPETDGQLGLLNPAELLLSALSPFLEVSFRQIVLVLGHDYHRVLNAIKTLPPHVSVAIHRKHERGLASGVPVGLGAMDREVQAVVISRGDQIVEAKIVERLINAFREHKGRKKIFIPLYQSKRGLPWLVSMKMRSMLNKMEGEDGLNLFLKDHKKEVTGVSALPLLEPA